MTNLQLVKTNSPQPSLARKVLIGAVADIGRLKAERTELDTRRAKLLDLTQAEQRAEAELAAIVAEDAQALTAWVDGGADGDAPTPDAKRRETAARKIGGARHQAATAKQALDALDTKIRSSDAELISITQSLPGLRAAAMWESFQPIVKRFQERTLQALQDEQFLVVAAQHMFSFDRGLSNQLRNATLTSEAEHNARAFIAHKRAAELFRAIAKKFESPADLEDLDSMPEVLLELCDAPKFDAAA